MDIKREVLFEEARQLKKLAQEFRDELKVAGQQQGYLELLTIKSAEVVAILVEEVDSLQKQIESMGPHLRPIR